MKEQYNVDFKNSILDFSLQNESCVSSKPSVNNNILRTIIENDPHQTTTELAERMNIDHSTVACHLSTIGKIKNPTFYIHQPNNFNRCIRSRFTSVY